MAGIVQQQAAVDDAGFFTERVEDVADHGGCGGFAAGAADGYVIGVLVKNFGQQVGTFFIGMFFPVLP